MENRCPRLRALCGAVLLLLATAGGAEVTRLPPADEGASDAGWQRFKARLLDALVKRDAQFILGIVDPRIRNTSGSDGAAEFNKLWEPRAATSPLWVELPKVLFLGGVFVKRERNVVEFCAPYVYYRWPDGADAGSSGAIIVKEALLKAAPAANSATLQALSYDLVKVLDWEVADQAKDNAQKWAKLATAAGEGYIPEEHVRSPLEYRACFVNSGTRWRMTGLEVGE
jgi:hypothetical protein